MRARISEWMYGDEMSKIDYGVDPTIRFENNKGQPLKVHKEKVYDFEGHLRSPLIVKTLDYFHTITDLGS